jgi:hypothetical protein
MSEASDDSDRDIFDEARNVVEDSEKLADDVGDLYERVPETGSFRDLYEKNPYAVLAAAAGAGYLLGGGLFTPFTKRILKTGMKAVVIPVAVSRLRKLTQGAASDKLDHLEEEVAES